MNKVIDDGICMDEEEGEDGVLDGDGIGGGSNLYQTNAPTSSPSPSNYVPAFRLAIW